jgi:hypothetical protein
VITRKPTNLLFLLVLLGDLLLRLLHLLLYLGLLVLEISQEFGEEARALGPVLLLGGTLGLKRKSATITDRTEWKLTGLSSSLASSFAGSAAGVASVAEGSAVTAGVCMRKRRVNNAKW